MQQQQMQQQQIQQQQQKEEVQKCRPLSFCVYENKVQTSSVFTDVASSISTEALIMFADDIVPWRPIFMNRANRVGIMICKWAAVIVESNTAEILLDARDAIRDMVAARVLDPRSEPNPQVLELMDSVAQMLWEAEPSNAGVRYSSLSSSTENFTKEENGGTDQQEMQGGGGAAAMMPVAAAVAAAPATTPAPADIAATAKANFLVPTVILKKKSSEE